VSFTLGERLRGLNETAGAVRVFLDIHAIPPSAYSRRPEGSAETSSLGFRHILNDLDQGRVPDPCGIRPSRCRSDHGSVKEGRAVFHADLARNRRIVNNAKD
jgi:hypothetical protein